MRCSTLSLLLCWCCVFCAAPSAHARQTVGVYYVAPNGNDTWSGGLLHPNAARTDGPFRTLRYALDAIRQKRQRLTREDASRLRGFTIKLEGGTYPLAETLALTEADSGTKELPLTIEAVPNQTPTISGGVRVTGWKRTGSNRWEVLLPLVKTGQWYFEQLYVNDVRRYRPRFPQSGYAFTGGELPATPANASPGSDHFRFKAGDMRADWHNRADVEVITFHTWTASRLHITDVNEAERAATLADGTSNNADSSRWPAGKRYLAENVYEALSKPGQWYLDRKTGVLTYLAKPGEDPNHDIVIAPRTEKLLTLTGTHYITFRGIRFAHTKWSLPPSGQSYGQADINVASAIEAENAQNCVFENCTVQNTGGWAFDFKPGTKHCEIARCELRDLGAGGVKIGGTANEDENKLASHNRVHDCRVIEGGRVHPAAVGVWIGHSPYNTIEHNEIADFYYTGVSVGWSWGYNPSGAHHNRIAFNHLHHLGQGVLSDMGGIYTLGLSPGTTLDHNRIHDVESIEYGGWGIYFDEGTTEALASNNIVYNTKSAPFHQHYGTKNVVENNIFAWGQEAQLMRTRADNGPSQPPAIQNALSFTLRRNVVYYTNSLLLGSNWSGTNYTMEKNLYFNTSGPVVFPNNATLATWQAQGHDSGSVVADPRFVSPSKGDFAIRTGSPVSSVGFVPIDPSDIGPRGLKPYTIRTMRAFPPPPPPQPVSEDFEDVPTGSKPSGALTLLQEADFPDATARVTETTAATGRRSLQVTDVAGQRFSYSPHLFAQPRFADGVLVGRFAVRVEAGADIIHEWRDAGSPYQVGPTLHIDGKGGLFAGSKPLADLPLGTWVSFEIRCPIGRAATGNYDLTMELPGRVPPQRWSNLPCGSGKAFQALRWWGFISNANAATTFYLDDLFVGPQEPTPR